MPSLTPEEAAQLGYTPTSREDLTNAVNKDPWAVLMAMLSGEDTANSGGMGRIVSSQGGGFNPTRTANEAGGLVDSFGIPGQVAGSSQIDARLRAGAQAAPNANPYSTIVANQARPAQEALYAQMRAMQAGPSLAAMQGQRAQGQNLQAALGAGAGRGAMMQAGQIGAGLAGDTGMGRLAEQFRGVQGLGGMSGGVRGADLGVANAQSQTGIQQRGLDDAMRQFYAQQGAQLTNVNADLAAERAKLLAMGKLKRDVRDLSDTKQFAGSAATTLTGGMK